MNHPYLRHCLAAAAPCAFALAMTASAPAAAAPSSDRREAIASPPETPRSPTWGQAARAPEVEEEAANVLTLKFAVLQIITPAAEAGEAMAESMMNAMAPLETHVASHVGVGLSFERALWPGGLAAELNLVLSPEAGGLTVPSELLVKKLFPLSPGAEPFVGLGLAAELLVAGEFEPQYGVAADAGAYFWLERSIGVVVETEYSLFLSRETEHEIALAAGGALRF